ncbi:hypothetical protein K474DRAFT_288398 [Panus rudis PR-1116 ss-1]|nr:hypothetical protein K474DRAFT_288398 [Panus rudis PR-1116 ss-1]
MGSHSIMVYIHRDRWFSRRYKSDGSPGVLGVQIIEKIPTQPESFRKWLNNIRKTLDKEYETAKVKSIYNHPPDYSDVTFIYSLDLDDLSFNYHTVPMFQLDHMPPHDVFLAGIHHIDEYGSLSPPRGEIFAEYLYPPPTYPPKAQSSLQKAYFESQRGIVSSSDLLSRPTQLSNREATRVGFLEVAVASMMSKLVGGVLTQLATSPPKERTRFSKRHTDYASLLIQLAINPTHYVSLHERDDIPGPPDDAADAEWWIRQHISVRFVTHLDDAGNLRNCVAGIVQKILKHDGPQITYGVLFDLLRVVLVCVDRSTQTFTHTEALQFIPDRFGTSPSTPGIEALARLGDIAAADDLMFYLRHWRKVYTHPRHHDWSMTTYIARARRRAMVTPAKRRIHLPLELWTFVASYISSGLDLTNFALASHMTASAALSSMKYPQIGAFLEEKQNCPATYMIVVAPSQPPHPTTKPSEAIHRLTDGVFTAQWGEDERLTLCLVANRQQYNDDKRTIGNFVRAKAEMRLTSKTACLRFHVFVSKKKDRRAKDLEKVGQNRRGGVRLTRRKQRT